MRYVTDNELEQIRVAKGENFQWNSKTISHFYGESSKKYIYLPEIKDKVIMFQCLKCHQHCVHDECGNCSHTKFEIGRSNSGAYGMYCSLCERGFTTWTCRECETRNPVSKTFFLLEKSVCFIATAAYGSSLAPEVVLLRQFRDTRLRHNRIGNWTILVYETLSPPLADWISKRNRVRFWIQRFILSPLARFVERRSN